MTEHRVDGPARRAALQRGLGVVAGVALAAGAGLAAKSTQAAQAAQAAPAKLAQSVVKYVDVGKDPGKDCDDCLQFVPGKTAQADGSCKIVEGTIKPHGHCIAFTPKPKK